MLTERVVIECFILVRRLVLSVLIDLEALELPWAFKAIIRKLGN